MIRNVIQRITLWGKSPIIQRNLSIVLIIATIAAGVATYFAFNQSPFYSIDSKSVLILLNVDLVLLLFLGTIIARYLVSLWAERRQNQAGSRLHVRMVMVFSALAIVPTVLMALFSAFFFNMGVQSWFSERVQTALNESIAVAEAYLEEHKKVISVNVQSLAADLHQELHQLINNPEAFDHRLTTESEKRALTEAIIFTPTGKILARSQFSYALELEHIEDDQLAKAQKGVLLYANAAHDRVRALALLDYGTQSYLLVGRPIDPQVLKRILFASQAVEEYRKLQSQSDDLAIKFAVIFMLIALLLLLLAVWGGLAYANDLARPIGRLVDAAERIKRGDLSVRLSVEGDKEDLGLLMKTFNRMVERLEAQRAELLTANQLLDERRHFTETVLSGVSAGVIGLDRTGAITLPNQSASNLLQLELLSYTSTPLIAIVPEFEDILDEALASITGFTQKQITLMRGHTSLTLLVRVAVERMDGAAKGYVVTFDDVTEMLQAQRKAAWADVARLVAHEVKNPLTPIQLSAERLKRKYLSQIHDDPESFKVCIDTIVRQVTYLGHIIGEFSNFARMPTPVLRDENIVQLVQQALDLQVQAYPAYQFTFDHPSDVAILHCDAGQMNQILTNLLQNAIDAINEKPEPKEPGSLHLALQEDIHGITLTVTDNGIGLPKDMREHIMEPYVTTKAKGTGLGLAVVKKIMEDHNGTIQLSDSPGGGTQARLMFSITKHITSQRHTTV